MKNLILIFLPAIVSCATTYVPPDRITPTREITQDLAVAATPEPEPTPEPMSFKKWQAESNLIELNAFKETISKLEQELKVARSHGLRDMYRVFWDIIETCPLHEKCDIPDFWIMRVKAESLKSNRDQVSTYEKTN